MAEAHERVCRVIRQSGSSLGKVEVGFSKNWTYFQPYRKARPWDVLMAAFIHAQLNSLVMKRFLGGRGESSLHFSGRQLLRAHSFQESQAAGADVWFFT